MYRHKIIIPATFIFSPLLAFSQFINKGDFYVSKKSTLSIYYDVTNESTADYINDGNIYYHNSLYNKGFITFTPSIGGNTFFVGNNVQIIESDLELDFYNLTFENNSIKPSFKINADLSIDNRAYFNSGIVELSNYNQTFKFNRNADYLNASNISYVEGRVEKKDYDSFIFPIGAKGYFNPIEMNAYNDVRAKAQYFFKDSNTMYSHINREKEILLIDEKEYWEIDIVADQKNIISLNWNTLSTPLNITIDSDESTLEIVHWNNRHKRWERTKSAVSKENQQITAAIEYSGIYTLARVKSAVILSSDIKIYNALTPNNDGLNDIFLIENIEKYPQNSLEIYDRYGALVYQTDAYGISNNWFEGISKGNITIKKGEHLESGTYFYILQLLNPKGKNINYTGYLYIN